MSNHNKRAVWIELIGFDNRLEDMGVEHFLEKAGFIPDALVLLIWSSDFVHSYSPDASDDTLLGWDCSAYGCRRQSLEHEIQQWTKGEVKTLLANLKKHKIDVYLSFFDQIPHEFQIKRFQIPETPKLWVNDHKEILFTTEKGIIAPNICPWKRLADGSYYEDFLLSKLIPCLEEYGFDGLHGADGYAHQRFTISRGDFSDDIIEQAQIPCEAHCDGDVEKIQARAKDILLNHRKQWTEFHRQRHAKSWKHVSGELRKNGKKLIMNSYWTRDPFEALFRYGEDFALLAELDLEALILEAPVADELSTWHSQDVRGLYKLVASLLRIRAILPEVPIWHMNTLRDVLENYNIVQEFPALMEAGTEMLQHALLYHNKKWSYSLSGLLSCLSDGLTRDNWNWVRAMWDFVLDKGEISAYSGAVAVFSQSMLERELDAYLEERFTSSWHLHCLLLGSGAPLNAIVPLSEVLTLPGNTPLVVLNSRFLSSEERAVLQQHKGEQLCIDPEERSPVELNDPPFFTGALPEPVPSSEQIAAWVQQICAMAPNVPQPAETGHRVFEETLTSGEKLLSVFNDQLYCRYVQVKMPMPFDQLQPIINHITPPFTTADTFMVHLPSFGVVALKVFPKN